MVYSEAVGVPMFDEVGGRLNGCDVCGRSWWKRDMPKAAGVIRLKLLCILCMMNYGWLPRSSTPCPEMKQEETLLDVYCMETR